MSQSQTKTHGNPQHERLDEQDEEDLELDGYLDLDKEILLSRRPVPQLARSLIISSKGPGASNRRLPQKTKTKSKTWKETRLLERDNPFHQASGAVKVTHVAKGETRRQVVALYQTDWFHVLLAQPTWKTLLLLSTIVTLCLLAFALIYLGVDRSSQKCHMGEDDSKISFQAAFGFSLITASTVGYGFISSGDPFFFDCPLLVIAVFFQVLQSLLLNAFVVGVILQQVGRANLRAHQVVFSNKAVIRRANGKWFFSVQVFDLDRRHPVVEAHVRFYAVLHPSPEGKVKSQANGLSSIAEDDQGESSDVGDNVSRTYQQQHPEEVAYFRTKVLRIQSPNDELGGVLFLSLPCIVTHQIDSYSPLLPADFHLRFKSDQSEALRYRLDCDTDETGELFHPFPGLVLRDEDGEVGDRSTIVCPVCGDDFPSKKHLLRHIRYNQAMEKLDNLPTEEHEDIADVTTHLEIDLSTFVADIGKKETDAVINAQKAAIEQHLRDNRIEIVVLVEGIEARSSNTFQARYSYTVDDIAFDCSFAPCMETTATGHARMNLNAFHKVVFHQSFEQSQS